MAKYMVSVEIPASLTLYNGDEEVANKHRAYYTNKKDALDYAHSVVKGIEYSASWFGIPYNKFSVKGSKTKGKWDIDYNGEKVTIFVSGVLTAEKTVTLKGGK